MRTKGSCRFAPYYKVEWYDATALCWRVIQKAFSTEEQARAAFLWDKKCRVQEVTEKGRNIL
jgi:hypothetical protein